MRRRPGCGPGRCWSTWSCWPGRPPGGRPGWPCTGWSRGWAAPAARVASGLALSRLVERLAVPGARVEQAGGGFAGDVAEIQQKIGRVPVVGDQLQAPFGRLAGTGRTLAEAGVAQQEVVHQLALWLGVVVAAVPVVTLLLVWLPRRVAWAREAGAASRLRMDGA